MLLNPAACVAVLRWKHGEGRESESPMGPLEGAYFGFSPMNHQQDVACSEEEPLSNTVLLPCIWFDVINQFSKLFFF